jgi:GNAT superfamily N-acetyltransferase
VYFGLVRAAQGAGLGRALLTHAVREAWAMDARRVWLHTCTLDAPTALPNYLARGFRVTGEERYTVPAEG